MTARQQEAPNERFQFSLRGLMCLTTLLAVCFSVFAWKGIWWGAVFILVAAVGYGVWHYRRTIIRIHPVLWTIAIYSAATYLLCVFVNPPFTVIGGYDETKVDTRMTDWVALALVVWFFGGVLAACIIKNPSARKWLSISVAFGVPIGILLLACLSFSNAAATEDPGVKRFWLCHGVGTLGVGWLFLGALFWQVLKVQLTEKQNPVEQGVETKRRRRIGVKGLDVAGPQIDDIRPSVFSRSARHRTRTRPMCRRRPHRAASFRPPALDRSLSLGV